MVLSKALKGSKKIRGGGASLEVGSLRLLTSAEVSSLELLRISSLQGRKRFRGNMRTSK